MKKQISLFIFIFFAIVAIGQSDMIVIKGKIFEGKQLLNKIPGMNTWLIINDSLIIESKPDSSGEFEYKVSRNFFKSTKVKLTAFQDQNILDKIYPVNDCPYLRMQPTYFRSDIDIKVPPSEVNQLIINLEPIHVFVDIRVPCIGFKKNSVEFTNCLSDNSDTSLFCIRKILKEIPTSIVQVNVHSWNETNLKDLTKKRGEYIMSRLQNIGVDTTRIIMKLQEDHRPIIKSDVIKKAPNQADKDALDQKNRRATFQIISS